MTQLAVLDIDRASYESGLELQHRLHEYVLSHASERACVVLVEHDPPVITLGRAADKNNITATATQLGEAGVELHESTRGGDVTYHGPGQLVGYPIIRVDLHGRDVHEYLRNVEEVIIRALAKFGLQGGRKKGLTGVWVGEEKVAAIGIAVRRWVSYHGFSLNICPNMSHFGLIVPCGITDKGVTSMSALLGRDVSVNEVKPAIMECLGEVFGFDSTRPTNVDDLCE